MSEEQIPAAQKSVIPYHNTELPQMTEDQVLAFTRGIRIQVASSLMAGGAVSGENSDRILLTNMLNGLDSQATNIKKIAADQKNADNAAVIVAELLRTINKQTMFQGVPGNTNQVIDVEARVVPNIIPDIPALPGEMEVSPPQMDYTTFVRSQGKDVDQIGKNVVHDEAVDDDGT